MTPTEEAHAVKTKTGSLLALATVCAAVSVACVAIPMFVIRPFRPQGATELEIALVVRHAGPWFAGLCAAVTLLLLVLLWKSARLGGRLLVTVLLLLATAGAVLTQVNIFE